MADNGILLPRFFKVFLSESSSQSLMIPTSYMEHLDDPLPGTAKLQGIGGRTWTVSLKKIRNRVYFTDGWSKFAEEHDLKDGEFLVFVYDGHRTFDVSRFNLLGCKEIQPAVDTSYSDEEDETSMDDDDNDEEETNFAVFVGNSNSKVIANTWFKTKLKNRRYELLVPAEVVKKHKLRFGQSIRYIDEEWKSFKGERAKWNDGRVSFKGWDRICRRNQLKNEDIVKCELLHTGKLVHSVRIHIKRGSV